MKRKEQGFTIIELLVAMAILGLLIGLLIPGIGIVRRGARNTARRTSLQAIQSELEDQYPTTKTYPTSISATILSDMVDPQFTGTVSMTGVESSDCPTTSMPAEDFRFFYKSTGNEYVLGVCLEPNGEAFELTSE